MYFMCIDALSVYMSVPCMPLVSLEAREGIGSPVTGFQMLSLSFISHSPKVFYLFVCLFLNILIMLVCVCMKN